jgi:hypothetical protein
MQSDDQGGAGRGSRGGTRSAATTERPRDPRRGPFDRILRTEPGGHDGPDRAAIYVAGTIIGLALLLLILLLPPISILSDDGGGGGSEISSTPGTSETYQSEPRRDMPDLPEGLEAASLMFDLSAPEDQQGASRVTVPLKEKQTEARNLGLYSFVDDSWQRLSDVTLIVGGEAARGDVNALPGNVAVLKRSQSTMEIAGVLNAGTELDEGAAPALTVLHPVVFLTAPDGGLVGTPPAVPPAGYEVVPGVVTLNPSVIDDILRDSELQGAHATAIADAVRNGNYQGINLDYRLVNPQLRDPFTAFIELVAQALHNDGRTLTITLPMPLGADGEIDEGAYNWAALAEAVDTIEVAAPDIDQELYFQRAEVALDYIVETVDRTKVLLTITSTSVERGGDGLRAMPFDEAMGIAAAVDVKSTDGITPNEQVQIVARNLAQSEGASGMAWNDTSRTVQFQYNGAAGERTVWIANEFSVAWRLELAQRYELGGVVLSDVSTGITNIWGPVRQIADTGNLTLTKPNGELLVPAWTAAENGGTFDPATGTSVVWTAPAEAGTYNITIVVSDGVDRVGQTAPLDVAAAPAAAE